MTRTINIEVYCDTTEGERDLFGVVTDPPHDIPKFYEQVQEWAREKFNHLEVGDSITEAGELEYEPNDGAVELRTK